MPIPSPRRSLPVFLLCATEFLPAAAFAATRTWTGLGADTNWMTAGNWDLLPSAGDDLVFPGGVPGGSLVNNNNFPASTSFNSITINGNGYALSGNAITLGTGGIGGSGSPETINLAISIPATVPLSMSSVMDFFGVISGAGGVTMTGSGIARLRGANTYTGASTVNAGRLSIEATMLASAITVNSGGTFPDGSPDIDPDRDFHGRAGHRDPDGDRRLSFGDRDERRGRRQHTDAVVPDARFPGDRARAGGAPADEEVLVHRNTRFATALWR